jgi:hypothetical protein
MPQLGPACARSSRASVYGWSTVTDADLQRIADETGETIETVRDLADAMACCAAEGDDEARVERQQRAREAGLDAYPSDGVPFAGPGAMLDAAIETATRVRVDADVIAAFKQYGHPLPLEPNIIPALTAAFRAAGFEVEQ